LLLAHQSLPVPRADAICDEVPEKLSTIMMKMMAKKPEERYQTAAEVIEALQPFAAVAPAEDDAPVETHVNVAKLAATSLWENKWVVPGMFAGAALFGLLAAVAVNLIKSSGK
jgi:hypothetical protein